MDKTPPPHSDQGYNTFSYSHYNPPSDHNDISVTDEGAVGPTSEENGAESVHRLAGPSTAINMAVRDQGQVSLPAQTTGAQTSGSDSSNTRSNSSASTQPSKSTHSGTGESLGIADDLAADLTSDHTMLPPPRPASSSTPKSRNVQELRQEESALSRNTSHSVPRAQAMRLMENEGLKRRSSDPQLSGLAADRESVEPTGGAVGGQLQESRPPRPAPRRVSARSHPESRRSVVSPVPSPRPSTSSAGSTLTLGTHTTVAGRSMKSFDNRKQTYNQGPFTQSDRKACQAGFYLTEDHDVLRCHSCQREIKRSAAAHLDVWSLHARLSPTCVYVLENQGSEYVEENRGELSDSERYAVIQVTGEPTASAHDGGFTSTPSTFSMESLQAALSALGTGAGDFSPLTDVVTEILKINKELKQQVGELQQQVNTNERVLLNVTTRVATNAENYVELSLSLDQNSHDLQHQMSKTSENSSLILENHQKLQGQEERLTEVDEFHTERGNELMRGQDQLHAQMNLDRLAQNHTNRELEEASNQQSAAINNVRAESAAAIQGVEKKTKENANEIKYIKETRLPGIDREARDHSSDEEP